MTKSFLTLATVISLLLTGCQNSKKEGDKQPQDAAEIGTERFKVGPIPFTGIKNYFVKNTVKQVGFIKIETAENFNAIFGKANVSGAGAEGQPTKIDFSKQYVMAILKPTTDLSTTLVPKALERNAKGNLVLTYAYTTGEKQSYSTRPCFAIGVDKLETGTVILKEVQ
jgi:uncharacterized lipoprotein NlpE involved in copper resistance